MLQKNRFGNPHKVPAAWQKKVDIALAEPLGKRAAKLLEELLAQLPTQGYELLPELKVRHDAASKQVMADMHRIAHERMKKQFDDAAADIAANVQAWRPIFASALESTDAKSIIEAIHASELFKLAVSHERAQLNARLGRVGGTGVVHARLFGASIESILANEKAPLTQPPLFVESILGRLEQLGGLRTEGIFRVSGEGDKLAKANALFESGEVRSASDPAVAELGCP